VLDVCLNELVWAIRRAVVFLDALVLKIRDGGSVQRRACYLATAIAHKIRRVGQAIDRR
jgi:transposase-like protein